MESDTTTTPNHGNNQFENDYEDTEEIGIGCFGKVYKVKDKSDKTIYAVKEIDLSDLNDEEREDAKREVDILNRVSPKYAVKFYTQWLQQDKLYIKMELLSSNLMDILEVKLKAFGRKSREPMDCVEYFISCEILRQILESVQDLHELNPQIIHRDLKPRNILIDYSGQDGRFVKLCDFGLSTVHDKVIHYRSSKKHTSGTGDPKYLAPEVNHGAKYDHRCDIYSLALIGGDIFGLEIFNICLESSQPYSTIHPNLNTRIVKLITIFVSMLMTPIWTQRPECSKVLSEYNEWSIDRNIVRNDPRFDGILKSLQSYDNKFFYNFIKHTIESH